MILFILLEKQLKLFVIGRSWLGDCCEKKLQLYLAAHKKREKLTKSGIRTWDFLFDGTLFQQAKTTLIKRSTSYNLQICFLQVLVAEFRLSDRPFCHSVVTWQLIKYKPIKDAVNQKEWRSPCSLSPRPTNSLSDSGY
jgi:hypothetical protein